MGQDAGQIIDALNCNTATAHQAVEQLDVASLEGVVHNRVDMINDLSDEGLGYWDKVREVANVKEHPVGEIAHDENGKVLYLTDENGEYIKDSDGEYITLYHFLNAEDEQYLQAGSDGKVHVSFNGIFTPPYEAAVYAEQHAENKNEPLYFVVFPEADSAISELLVAGYQKFMENNFWGLTNSTQEAKDLMYSYGLTGLELYGHSRGTMTLGNMLNSFKQEGVHGIANENTTINLYGPAFNALVASGLLGYVSDGKQTTIGFDGNRYDFVSRIIGGNGYTYETIPTGSNMWKEWWRVIMNPISSHTCLGDVGYKCQKFYGTSHREQFPLSKSRSKK
ncbi:filamentous hemagglutinin [Bartonella sp. AP122HLJHH]|uniref:filamentous hemagglutinin n=1 Tax=Bartonella sp. AP122HLJHH TaxID=3243466 RepID=UPI0035CF5FDE